MQIDQCYRVPSEVFRPLDFFFSLFVTLQPYSKMYQIVFFILINLHTIPENDKAKTYFFYISIQTLYSVLCWSTFWQRLQSWVFLGMTLQTWHICIWGGSPILCRSSQALSGWMGSVAAQLFSGLSRYVRSGSSPGPDWATQGHSETCPEATPALSWLCA